MITVKRNIFNRLNTFLSLSDEILRYGTIDGSVVWEVFNKEGFELIMEKIPEEAKNWPEFNNVMQGWTPDRLTPWLIMRSVIHKMITNEEIVIED